MTGTETEKARGNTSEFIKSYLHHKHDTSVRQTKIMLLLIGIFNLLLLIPDGAMLGNTENFLGVLVARATFSVILFIFFAGVNKLKSFKSYSLIVSACELLALAVYIYVFRQYEEPDLLIQAMGLFIVIVAVFLIPNEWKYMLGVSIIGGAAFLTCALFYIESPDMVEYWVAVVYISVVIILCAQTAYLTEKYQFREFAARKELESISATDFLTKTANRYKMDEEANKWILFCRSNGMPLSLVFVDIDDFKMINDVYGHLTGDSVLTGLTELIQSQLRKTDVISRWGGDEFVLLLPNTLLDEAVALTDRIKTLVCESVFAKDIHISCCYGVVEMKEDEDFDNMLKEADGLMYSGKKRAKNSLNYKS